jgi:glutaredoxin-related protein
MPQIYVNGELIGGSDIALEMLEDGSLREMFDAGRQQA